MAPDASHDTFKIKPPGSRAFLLSEVATPLAAASPEALRAICAGPVLLRIPETIFGQVSLKIEARERLMCLAETDAGQIELHFLPAAEKVEMVRLGRATDADVVLGSKAVSRNHAVLRSTAGGWVLLDSDSKGGTTVEGVTLKPWVPAPVSSGSILGFASYKALFVDPVLLHGLTQHMCEAGLEREAEAESPQADQPEPDMRVPPEGMQLRDLVEMASFRPGMLASSAHPFLLQIPVEPVEEEEVEQTDDAPIDLTQKFTSVEITEVRRSNQVGEAVIHSLRPDQPGKRTIVGRGEECDVVLAGISPSKRHAMLWQGKDGHWRIIDLESRNGTYVNGKRLPPGLALSLPRGKEQLWFAGHRALFLLPSQLQGLADTLA